MELDASQLGADDGASGGGEFSITASDSAPEHANCPTCGHSGGNSNTASTMGTSGGSDGAAADLDVSTETTGTLPGADAMLPSGWTVDDIRTLMLAVNTALVLATAYYSYRQGS